MLSHPLLLPWLVISNRLPCIPAMLLALLLFSQPSVYAQKAKDGVELVTSTGVIFNRYTRLAASIPAGSNVVPVSNINDLSATAISGAANNPYTSNALSRGDLIMIIKMQGATINQTNSNSYGEILNYNGTGTFEFAVVDSVALNNIYLCIPTVFPYDISGIGRVQVIRVPRLSYLTIQASGSLTGRAWGNVAGTGGVVSIEVDGNALINGTINATGIGFRGGAFENNTHPSADNIHADFVSASAFVGAEKGESIAGYQTDYDVIGGRFGRGAPANGGGGGNTHNAGGGGGANAGLIQDWTGFGNPDTSITGWKTAWNLESQGFANSRSSGGGRGGYTFAMTNRNALADRPGLTVWTGNGRQNVGGFGGRPLSYAINKLFLGGGGGAGDGNNSSASGGANGGGIIHITVNNSMSGSGSIISNGNSALPTDNTHNDAPGGGGAGGTIILNVQGLIEGVTVNAKGGTGGNQLIVNSESEGPGGGGGGGFVSVTSVPTSANVAGGSNGTTSSSALTEFIPNGATRGGVGEVITRPFATMQPLACNTLQVQLISFGVKKTTQNNLDLQWTCAGNEDVLKFEIEYSTGEGMWRKLSDVQPKLLAGSVFYKTQTLGPAEGQFYVRMKIVKKDRSVVYSDNVRIINNSPVRIVENNATRITWHLPGSFNLVQVYNNIGQLAKTFTVPGHLVSLDKTNFSRGIYHLRINSGSQVMSVSFFVE